jgi:hypothetical protein
VAFSFHPLRNAEAVNMFFEPAIRIQTERGVLDQFESERLPSGHLKECAGPKVFALPPAAFKAKRR